MMMMMMMEKEVRDGLMVFWRRDTHLHLFYWKCLLLKAGPGTRYLQRQSTTEMSFSIFLYIFASVDKTSSHSVQRLVSISAQGSSFSQELRHTVANLKLDSMQVQSRTLQSTEIRYTKRRCSCCGESSWAASYSARITAEFVPVVRRSIGHAENESHGSAIDWFYYC